MSKKAVVNIEYLSRTLILLGFSLLLFWLVGSGEIMLFINPRFEILTVITATVLLIMFLSQIGRCIQPQPLIPIHHHNKSRIKVAYVPLVLPLVMGFLLPNSALDANLANKKGIDQLAQAQSSSYKDNATNQNNNQTQTSDNSQNTSNNQSDALLKASVIKLSDANFAQSVNALYANPNAYAGKEINFFGFVYTDNTFAAGQFAVSRYVITCCSADASVSGILCDVKNAGNYKEGSWVTVTGTLQPTQFNGETVPMVKVNSINPIQAPKNQYVYIRYK